jgi:hypothetical protein
MMVDRQVQCTNELSEMLQARINLKNISIPISDELSAIS